MSLPIVLTSKADADYEEARDWHESRNAGDGDVFADRVQKVFDLLSAQPLMHAQVFGEARRALVPKTPYAVIYIPEPTRVVVVSVFHTSRDPSVWQGRV